MQMENAFRQHIIDLHEVGESNWSLEISLAPLQVLVSSQPK